ncbi:hypothetical protein K474DRAFT_1777156 [Panus rudis PR-1116 ss-1]|nr:hypothetical protein K474DRAFT_1777156 [Panus rudis PR-1116 ss-1]
MFHLLRQRLSGISNRRVYTLPFSRHIKGTSANVEIINKLIKQCTNERGVLVVLPEHILSLKLKAVEATLSADTREQKEVARRWRGVFTWLNGHARDILDESDELLHVRHQLIYTIGQQAPIEDHPNRWLAIQQILSLMLNYASHSPLPDGLEVHKVAGRSFHSIRITKHGAAKPLMHSIAESILQGNLDQFAFERLPSDAFAIAHRFLTLENLSNEDFEYMRRYCANLGLDHDGGSIMDFILREHYLLSHTAPSQRAEYGHPDVTLVLTCLSYYYGGLSREQVKQSFEILLATEDPAIEYSKWVHCSDEVTRGEITPSSQSLNHGVTVPTELRGINLKDHTQFNNSIMPAFAGNHATINFFLAQVVFPKEAKSFPYKLSTSGWDLAEVKTHPTTGFSDSLPDHAGDVSAAVFFDDTDELTVMLRDGFTEPFVSSPFREQMHQCLVYLDDAHTRGTDLKFPKGTQAAVTLGPDVTKDRLVQGCMRMRQLGHGHSVMFFASGEVDAQIRAISDVPMDSTPGILQVLDWAIHVTLQQIEQQIPHWAQQGTDYHTRNSARIDVEDNCIDLDDLTEKWRQVESRTLEDMYGYPSTGLTVLDGARDIAEMRERLDQLGVSSIPHKAGQMDEEQEREVTHELELERDIERPAQVKPAHPELHEDVVKFMETGVMPSDSQQFIQLAYPMDDGPIREHMISSPCIWATWDFCRTVQPEQLKISDYLRPVHWIMSSTIWQSNRDLTLVAMSSYEANLLLPPQVSEFLPSFSDLSFFSIPPLTQPLPDLTYRLRVQLNLWAGQLYTDGPAEYRETMAMLGIHVESSDGHRHIIFGDENDGSATVTMLDPAKDLVALRRKGMGYKGTPIGELLNCKVRMDYLGEGL